MEDVSKDLLSLLTRLLPGFVTGWVIYALTSHPKPTQFERVVQALVYSFLVGVVVSMEEYFVGLVGCRKFGESSELIVSGVSAVGLGLIFSYYSNNDKFHEFARARGWTTRASYPSEWYGAFSASPRYIVLHVDGSRRISGYPRVWPSDPASGHFLLENAAWLKDDGSEISLDRDQSILIPAKQVEMVEFLKTAEESSNATSATEHPAP